MENMDHWIFYLKLQKELPREYFTLDSEFKVNEKSLVPISMSALTEALKKSKRAHILIVIRNMEEYKYFNNKIKKTMKYLVRSGKVHLYIASSFNGVNDTAIMRRDYYHFMKLPVTYKHLCNSISHTVNANEYSSHQWPGGIRSSFKLVG